MIFCKNVLFTYVVANTINKKLILMSILTMEVPLRKGGA